MSRKPFPFLFVALASLLLSVMAPVQAFAAQGCPTASVARSGMNTGRFELGSCASNYTGIQYQSYEFTSKLVACIEGTIKDAVINMMYIISDEFGWVTAVLSTLVITFYGIRIAMGERELLKRSSTLFIKLAFVAAFMNILPDIVGWVFAILADMLRLVVGGVSPWQRIDAFLGNLVGAGPSIAMMNGLMGIVGASVFSSNVGVSLFFFGIIGMMNLLIFILSLIYTYLMAFLTIGFLLTLMPVMIPLALFFYTERYFKKWADIIVAAILTPTLIFAFVWMFVGIFDILIQNIFDVLGGNDFRAYWRNNSSLSSWMIPSDPNTNVMMKNLSTSTDVPCVARNIAPPVQSFVNPMAKNSFDAVIGRMARVSFGSNDVFFTQALSFAFITLWIFSSLMKSMLQLLPQVASSIAGVSSQIAFGANSAVIGKLQQATGQLQSQVQSGQAGQAARSLSGLTAQISQLVGGRQTP
ncbi:MAG: type IV secretion system protein [Alphaproteobacteria bacterium]|nr:type IV secretion system protein [Alphaproteobacteria bacterium]